MTKIHSSASSTLALPLHRLGRHARESRGNGVAYDCTCCVSYEQHFMPSGSNRLLVEKEEYRRGPPLFVHPVIPSTTVPRVSFTSQFCLIQRYLIYRFTSTIRRSVRRAGSMTLRGRTGAQAYPIQSPQNTTSRSVRRITYRRL